MIAENTERSPIRKGDVIRILPAFRDAGDHHFTWTAVDDEEKGRVSISPGGTGLTVAPIQTVESRMVECHPCPTLNVNQMLDKCRLEKRPADGNGRHHIFDPRTPHTVLFTGRASEVDDWLCEHRTWQLSQP